MKITKYFIVVLLIIWSQNAFSSWTNTSSYIGTTQTFDKIHGTATKLYVHEDYYINPFSSATIIRNTTNNVTNNYSVNGVVFNTKHSLYKSANSVLKSWSNEGSGISTQIIYLENTYTKDKDGILMPNQNVKVRKYYKVDFNYDKTPPTGGDLKLYNNAEGTEIFTYKAGTWLNTAKYYTMTCIDAETGCKCDIFDTQCEIIGGQVRTTPKILGHMVEPTATFKNNVDLGATITGKLPGGNKILYDQSTPRIGLAILNSDNSIYKDFYHLYEENRIYEKDKNGNNYDGEAIPGKLYYTTKNKVSIKANDKFKLYLLVQDQYINSSLNGTSGIKDYKIIIDKKNISNIFEKIYEKSNNYGIYNKDGTKKNSDTKGIILNDFNKLNQIGEYKITIESFDWAGNNTKTISYLNIVPTNKIDNNKSSIVSTGENKYGNNEDYISYKITIKDIYGHPIKNKKIDSIEQNCENINGCITIKTNSTNNSGINPLIIYDISNGGITNDNGEIEFKIRSLAPGEYTNKFIIKTKDWDDNYKDITQIINIKLLNTSTNKFLPPIGIGEIKLSNDNGINWDNIPEVGVSQKYKINLINKGGLNGFSNGYIDLNKSTIYSKVSGHIWRDFKNIDKYFYNDLSKELTFIGAIDGNENVLKGPEIETKDLKISYNLGGKNISYYLDNTFINGCNMSTLGLKTEGLIKYDGKGDMTGQEENFSDISKNTLRDNIRKNAFSQIKNMVNNQIINGVKYVEGDITLSGEISGYETLVIKDGNLIINGDLNKNKNKFGIIILKDGYNVNNDYNKKGNIYINNNVKYISANIYSDGTVRSAKSDGTKYNDNELTEKLDIYGSLFSRNTIGGAISGNTNYTLPGGQKTNNYELAEIYDLNYLRKVRSCSLDEYSTLIKYNPSIQTNPPKLFTN